MWRLIATLTIIAGSMMGMSCQSQPSRPPAETVTTAVATDQWEPSSPLYRRYQFGKPGDRESYLGFLLTADLLVATGEFVRCTDRLPSSVNELLEAGMVFHLPTTTQGTSMPVVAVGHDTNPAPNEVGVYLDDQELVLRLWGKQGDPSKILEFRHGLDQVLDRAAQDKQLELLGGGPESIRSKLLSEASSNSALPLNTRMSRGTGYYWASSELPEGRLRAFLYSVRARALAYLAMHGEWPTDWRQALAETGQAPINYEPVSSLELLAPEHAKAEGVRAGFYFDPKTFALIQVAKPSIPGLATQVFPFVIDRDRGEVTEMPSVTIEAYGPIDGAQPLFETILVNAPLAPSPRSDKPTKEITAGDTEWAHSNSN